MKTEVSILHHEYPARMRQEVADKLERLSRFFDRTVSIRAMLERQRESHRVELVANVGRGVVLVIDAREGSLGAAIDEAVDRMGRVLRRHKEKLTGARRRGGARVRT